jgi:hypothetical protein
MRLTWNATLGLVLAIALVLGSFGVAFAQNPPAQQAPPAQQTAQKPGLSFEGDLGLLLVWVKSDKTADFEAVVAKAKEALVKLDTPETKQEADTLKLYKIGVTKADSAFVLYLVKADPPVKGSEYSPLMLIYKAFPSEYASYLTKWKELLHTTPPQPFDFVMVK